MLDVQQPVESHMLASRYLLRESLGHGTYGDVYLATDLELDREVAVKVLRREYGGNEASIERFIREAKYAARVSPHPHIVTVFDLVHDGDTLCIVLEYVRGSSLRTLIDDRAPLPIPEALAIMEGILSALGAAHKRQIIHRDVKPSNVLLDEAATVKLTDFGIARALADGNLTLEGVAGTAAYMAPEQIRNEQAGPQADLYAAGIILFEMVTGRRLFTGESGIEVALKHLQERVPLPRLLNPVIPPEIERVILRALDKDWRRRFAGAEEMIDALHAATPQRKNGRDAFPASKKSTPRSDAETHSRVRNTAFDRTGTVILQQPRVRTDLSEPRRDDGESYELVLRALGAYLDQEQSDHITLVEVPGGFLLRKQRSLNTTTETVVQHVTLEALRKLLEHLEHERPRSRRVRHPGLWASFPQGHQDFFRALGHELDALSARSIAIDEADDTLAVTYQRPGDNGHAYRKCITILQREQIEQIVNAAFERRIDPCRRFGLEQDDVGRINREVNVVDDHS